MFDDLLATTGGVHTYFEFGRALTGPRDWILPLVVLFLLILQCMTYVTFFSDFIHAQQYGKFFQ